MVDADPGTVARPIGGSLLDAWRMAVGGSGRLVLVTGEAGIGKTTAARELCTVARREGTIVRWAACTSGFTTAHAPWLALLSGLGPGGQRAMEAVLGSESSDASAAGPARASAYRSVVSALDEATADRPAVLVLDDLHWADEGTVTLLDTVAGHLPAMAALVVGTFRDTDLEPGSRLTSMGGRADRVTLAGLDETETRTLLATQVGHDRAAALAAATLRLTAGNPFLVQQVGRLLAQDAGALDRHQLPAAARDLLRQRLHLLDDVDRLVLRAAAVLGSPFVALDVAAVAGIELGAVAAGLDRAARMRLVERAAGTGAWGFAHDLLRQAALDDESTDLDALHRRAAAVLAAGGAEPAAVAAHLHAIEGERPPDAAEWSVRAGDRALAALAWEEAAGHYERALSATDATSPSPARLDALAGLGRSRLLAADDDGAARAFAELADAGRRLGDPEVLARAALGFSADRAGFEVRLFDQRQIDLLEEAAAALVGTPAVAVRSTVLSRLSVALSLAAPDARRLALADEAVALARESGDPTVLARALGAHCDAIAGPDHVDERRAEATEIVAIAERTGDGALELLGRRLRFVAALEAGDVGAAVADATAFERRAAAVANPLYSWYGPLWRAQAAVIGGRVDEADALLAEADAIGRAAGSANAPMLVGVLALAVAWQRGDATGALALFEKIDERAPGLTDYPSTAGGLAYAYALAGRPARARELLDRADAGGALDPADDAEWLAVAVNVVRAAVITQHPSLARAVAALEPYADLVAFEGIGAGLHGPVARYLAVGCTALGRPTEAVAHARRAVEVSRPFGGVLHADALRTLAEALEAAAEGTSEAADLHAAADQAYTELGAAHLVRAPVPTAEPAPVADNEVRRAGEVWHLRFAGTSAIVKHSKGMADLAVLLARPDQEVHVSQLEGAGSTGLGDRGADALDPRAIAAYRDRLTELAEEIDDADAGHDLARAERARVEYDALVDQLSGAVGLGGRARRAGPDPVERLRKAVSARLRDAIRRIDAVHPGLGRHLESSVRTGTFCSYRPESPTEWRGAG